MLLGSFFFFFNDTATTEIYTLSLHDALPICHCICGLLQNALQLCAVALISHSNQCWCRRRSRQIFAVTLGTTLLVEHFLSFTCNRVGERHGGSNERRSRQLGFERFFHEGLDVRALLCELRRYARIAQIMAMTDSAQGAQPNEDETVNRY